MYRVKSSKINYPKRVAVILSAVVGVSVLTAVFSVLPVYIRDHLVDRPLAPDFVYIQQDITNGWLEMPTQTFYYATDISPEQFASKFEDWKLVYSDKHSVRMIKGNAEVNAHYYSYAEYPHGSKVAAWPDVDNFKGKKYIVYIHGTSMYFLNPDNIDPSMKQQIEDDIKRNYIR